MRDKKIDMRRKERKKEGKLKFFTVRYIQIDNIRKIDRL